METHTKAARQLMQQIFADLAQGDTKAFRDSLSDDFRWTLTGTNSWSGVYDGKEAVLRDLFGPLFARFATKYTNTATRFIAEGNWVVVECQGNVMTKAGQPYNNRYVWLCRVEDGQLREVIEYMDTELVATALPPRVQTGV